MVNNRAAIMFQGTGSDVGKSLVVAGLCRAFTRRGQRVRPFKPQNMSNNAAVTVDGGEIGRAQALQARACGVAPTTAMNPILLKPQTDVGAQLIVRGRMRGAARARDYQVRKREFLGAAVDAFAELERDADLILVEGAGSPAEINLRAGDIANMGFAEATGIPVVLLGDIDRGGVIASLVGTMAVIAPSDAGRVAGFLINRFRGDIGLFDDGLREISNRIARPSFGVIPFFADAWRLPAEDAAGLQSYGGQGTGDGVRVAVPMLSRAANFDDLDPLRLEQGVTVTMLRPGEPVPGGTDLVILLGSKSTIGDLAFLREQGWDVDIQAHLRRGGHLLGLCGGLQMLGTALDDPEGIEGPPGRIAGLGLLDFETVMTAEKTLVAVDGYERASGLPVSGYEMHIGQCWGPALDRPMLDLGGRLDGAVSNSGRIAGCYLHGLFARDAFRRAYLDRIRPAARAALNFEATVDATLDGLADHLEAHVDIDGLARVAGLA